MFGVERWACLFFTVVVSVPCWSQVFLSAAGLLHPARLTFWTGEFFIVKGSYTLSDISGLYLLDASAHPLSLL